MAFGYQFSLWLLPVILAVTLHEIAHGWVAGLCGDNTAGLQGRLSLNPFRHIDPIGSIALPAILLWISGFMFGWAKPVPVNLQQLRHPKRDMGWVAIAGPLANFIMALIWAIGLKLGLWLLPSFPNLATALIYMGAAGIFINSALMMLNLLPLPPLDGGRLLIAVLPADKALWLAKLEPWGLPLIVFLLLSGVLPHLLWPMMVLGMASITHLIGIPTDAFLQALAVMV